MASVKDDSHYSRKLKGARGLPPQVRRGWRNGKYLTVKDRAVEHRVERRERAILLNIDPLNDGL